MTFNGKKVLVLGSSGFIGSNLSRYLVNEGAILSRFSRTQRFDEGLDRSNWFPGEFGDQSALANAVDGQEIIFHCISGSVPGTSNLDIRADLSFNVGNTLGLLDICRAADVRRVVYLSSGGTVYGEPKSLVMDETHPTSPISAYGVSKLAIEKYLALYYRLYGLDYRIIRLANPYGPYQRAYRKQGLIAAVIEQHRKGIPVEIWGDGESVRDYLYVEDVMSGISAVTNCEGESKTFNLGSGIGRTVNDVLTDLEATLGEKIEKRYLKDRKVDVPRNILNIDLLKECTGWSPVVDWRESLTKTVSWLHHELDKEATEILSHA